MSIVKLVHITRKMLLYYTGRVHIHTSVENPPADGATCYLLNYWDIKALIYCSD
jgi:hypothetical protein